MAMNKFPEEVAAIRTLLAGNPDGLSIKAVATMLGMNRNSVAKYLDMLQMQGRVMIRQYGSAKIYTLANKLPASALLTMLKSNVLVFGKGLTVIDINEPFRELLQVPKTDLLGKTIGQLPFFLETRPDLSHLIQDGLKGKDARISTMLVLQDRSLPGTFTFSPVFFENGDPGVALIADIAAGTLYHPLETGADPSLTGLDEIEYTCRFRPDGTLTHVNHAYAELLHKPPAELIGHEWRPMVPENEFNKIKGCLSTLNPNQPCASLEFKAITPSGEARWQRWKFRGVFNHERKVSGFLGTGIDITEIKKLEERVSKDAEDREKMIREHNAEIQDLNKQIYTEISTREKTDFQLQFTQFAMNNASYMIIWISQEARFVYMNDKARQVLGYSNQELHEKKFSDLFFEKLPLPWEDIWDATRKDRQYRIETTLMTRRGHRIPVEIVFNYLEFKEKQYCCCFATDITERKEAEEALRESEERYRLVVENSHDVVVIYRENRFFYFNDRASEITGYTRDELNKMDIWNLILADDRTKMQEYGRKRIQGVPVPAVYTARLLTKEGEIRYADFTVERIILKGEPAILAMIKDITDRKHAEEAFRESRQILEAVLNSITVRVFWKDKNSVYLGCNTAFARDAGFIESADIIGKDDYAMSWHDQAERYRDDDRSVIASGSSKLLFEEPLTTPSGEIIQVLTSKVPLRDAGGEIIGVLGTYLDITDRKRAEVSLHEASLYSRNLIEVNLDPLVTISPDGRITDVNAATERVTGYPREFLIGTDFSDYFTDPEKARAGYRKVFEEGAVRDYLLEIKNRDRRIRQVLYNATIYRDESGTVKGVFAAARDITERTQAEEKNTKTGANPHSTNPEIDS